MKVSVIVLYHGEEIYLDDCLLSLEEQTYKDFETVLVVSGKDEPFLLTSKYESLNIKVVKPDKENVSAARNAGLGAASGEYVLFLDCDDYVGADYIAKLLECGGEDGCELMFGRVIHTWYKREFFLKKDSQESDGSDEVCGCWTIGF